LLWLQPNFLTNYKSKFSNRKVDMLAWFGTVDLILDKKHNFRVSTGLATCLFMIDERKQLSNRDLAE